MRWKTWTMNLKLHNLLQQQLKTTNNYPKKLCNPMLQIPEHHLKALKKKNTSEKGDEKGEVREKE